MKPFKRSTFALFLLLLAFGVYSACRLGFYLKYSEYFAMLSGFELVNAFIQGVRFDAAVLLLVMSPVALMIMILPSRRWRFFWTGLGVLFIAISALYLITDIYYFGFSSRHLVDEIRFLGNERDFIIGTLIEYRKSGLLLLGAVVIISGLIFKLSSKATKPEKKLWLKVIVLLVLSFVGIRGSFERKSLNIVDAYKPGVVAGNLALNAVYTTYRATGRTYTRVSYNMGMDEAFAMLGLDKNDRYPLLQTFEGGEKLNVIIILLESWTPQYINSYSDFAKQHNITPVFERLAQNGALFTRHYSVEKRSLEAIQSILTGIPPMTNLGRLGFGLEADSGGNMADIATQNGYDSIFMQTSRRRSYYIDAISISLGFKQYYGMEDFELVLDYPNVEAAEFGWDYEGILKFGDAVEKSKKPILGLFFSGTTHGPFAELPAPFNDYIGEEVDLADLMHYSDYSIGEFLKGAAEQPWFNDTIFILTADHIGGVGYPYSYNVPMLIYSPSGRIAPAVYTHVTSHEDILPTVLELSGMEGRSAILGKNVFDSEGERFAITTAKASQGIISNDIAIEVSDDMVVSSTFEGSRLVGKRFAEAEEYADAEEYRVLKRLMAYIQVTDFLMKENRWYPK